MVGKLNEQCNCANSANPVQMPQNVASDQDLQWLVTGIPMQNTMKVHQNLLKLEMDSAK